MEKIYPNLPNGAKVTWEVGKRTDAGQEQYTNLKLILDKNRYAQMEDVVLQRDPNSPNRMIARVKDIHINPGEKLKLFRMDSLTLSFHEKHANLIDASSFALPCLPDGSLSIVAKGIKAAHGVRDIHNALGENQIFAEDNRLVVGEFSATLSPQDVTRACKLSASLDVSEMRFENGLLAGLEIGDMALSATIPAHIRSLRVDPFQMADLSVKAERLTHTLDNGAVTFSLGSGDFMMKGKAISAAPFASLLFRHGWQYETIAWRMLAWNAIKEIDVDASLIFKGLTLRTQNILFNQVTSPFAMAGLSTILSEGQTHIRLSDNNFDLRDQRMAIGIGDWDIQASGQLGSFEGQHFDGVKKGVSTPLIEWPPIQMDEVHISASDAGALDAFHSIQGTKFTVWITRLRDRMVQELPQGAGAWIGEGATSLTRALADAKFNSPGRMAISQDAGLTLAEIYTVLQRKPEAGADLIAIKHLPGGNAE